MLLGISKFTTLKTCSEIMFLLNFLQHKSDLPRFLASITESPGTYRPEALPYRIADCREAGLDTLRAENVAVRAELAGRSARWHEGQSGRAEGAAWVTSTVAKFGCFPDI